MEWKQMVSERVNHVPKLRRNMISIGNLGSESYTVTFIDNSWKVTKGSLIIEKREKVGMLYLYTINAHFYITLASIGSYKTLFHHRLGNMSENGMQIIHSRNLFPYLKQVDLNFYEHRVYGKHKRVKFIGVGRKRRVKS
jgi:hypothetical protein